MTYTMVKKDIQPEIHTVKVVLTNGTVIELKSSKDFKDKEIILDADFINHPAWKEKSTANLVNMRNDRVDRFNKKHKNAF